MNTETDLRMEIADQSGSTEAVDPFQKAMRFVRWIGVAGMVIAGYLFLVRDIAGSNLLLSYYAFLGFSVLLTAGGFMCAKCWRDGSGARTLFGLSAVLLPAHMAQHSAFILATSGGEIGGSWNIGWNALFATLGVSLPVLIATTWLGYAGWLRKQAKVFAPLYIVCNLALLLPMRSPEAVVLIGTLIAIPCFVLGSVFRRQTKLAGTAEGIFSRLTLFVPFAVLMGRCFYMGYNEPILYAFALGFVSVVIQYPLKRELKTVTERTVARILALFFTFAAWFSVCFEIFDYISITEELEPLLVYGVPFGIASLELLLDHSKETKLIRIILGILFSIVFFTNLTFDNSILLALVGASVGSLMLLLACQIREKWLLVLGGINVGISLVAIVIRAVDYVDSVSWIAVGAGGFALVVLVSVIEKKRVEFLKVGRSAKSVLGDWS